MAFLRRGCGLLPFPDRRVPAVAVARARSLASPGPSGARHDGAVHDAAQPLEAPEASQRSREEKRFSRYDKNKDGKVQADEYLAARHRNFDRLDVDHNGALSFQEYAAKGIEKFNDAGGRKGWLTAAEFVATAPPQAKRKSTCSCGVKPPVPDSNEDNSN